MSAKFPRMPHLLGSPGLTAKADILPGFTFDEFMNGLALVVTEKLDGSNVCLTSKDVFARSHSSAPQHPSFDLLKAKHAQLKHLIRPGISVFCEYMYAVHTVKYIVLPSHLFVIAVRDDDTNLWLSWDQVRAWASYLDLPTVPEMAVDTKHLRSDALHYLFDDQALAGSEFGGPIEGFVIRVPSGFKDSEFGLCTAKWVKKDFVQTDDHWTNQEIVKQNIVLPEHPEV